MNDEQLAADIKRAFGRFALPDPPAGRVVVERDADDPGLRVLVDGHAVPPFEGSRECFLHRILRPLGVSGGQEHGAVNRIERVAVEGLEAFGTGGFGQGGLRRDWPSPHQRGGGQARLHDLRLNDP